MGQTLAIWKWRPAWPFRSDQRAWSCIAEDRAPFALSRLDAHVVAKALSARFGYGEDALFVIDICDFKGHRANWLILSAGWHIPESALTEVVNLCTNHGLHVYAIE